MRKTKTRFNAGFCSEVIDAVIAYCEENCVVGGVPGLVNALSSYILVSYFGVPNAMVAAELEDCSTSKVTDYAKNVGNKMMTSDVFSRAVCTILETIKDSVPAVCQDRICDFARESIETLTEIRNDPDYISLLEKYMILGVNPLAVAHVIGATDKLHFVSALIEHRNALTEGEFALLEKIIDYVIGYERMGFDTYNWVDAYEEILCCIQDEDSNYTGDEIKNVDEAFLQGLSIEELIACLVSHHITEREKESFLIEKSIFNGGIIRIYEALLKKLE